MYVRTYERTYVRVYVCVHWCALRATLRCHAKTVRGRNIASEIERATLRSELIVSSSLPRPPFFNVGGVTVDGAQCDVYWQYKFLPGGGPRETGKYQTSRSRIMSTLKRGGRGDVDRCREAAVLTHEQFFSTGNISSTNRCCATMLYFKQYFYVQNLFPLSARHNRVVGA